MITTEQARRLMEGRGHVLGPDGEKIGTIGQIFVDDRTEEPQWVTANTGLFGMGESFVPLEGAEISGDDLRVSHDKATVKDAPRISDADAHLSPEDEERLYSHYRIDDASPTTPSVGHEDHDRGHEGQDVQREHDTHDRDGLREERDHHDAGPVPGDQFSDPAAGVGALDRPTEDTRRPDHDESPTGLTESREAGTEIPVPPVGGEPTREASQVRPTQRARVRKYVVNEDVNITVPVTHEEVRIEHEPIPDGEGDIDGPGQGLDQDGTNRG